MSDKNPRKPYWEIQHAEEMAYSEVREWVIHRLPLFKEVYNVKYSNNDYLYDYNLDGGFDFCTQKGGKWISVTVTEFNMSLEEYSKYLRKTEG